MDKKIEHKVVRAEDPDDIFKIPNYTFDPNHSSMYEDNPHITYHIYHNTPYKNMWAKQANIYIPIEENTMLLERYGDVGIYTIKTINLYGSQANKIPVMANIIKNNMRDEELANEIADKLLHALNVDTVSYSRKFLSIRIMEFIPLELVLAHSIVRTDDLVYYVDESSITGESVDIGNDKIIVEITAVTKTGTLPIFINNSIVNFDVDKKASNNIHIAIKRNNIPVEEISYIDSDSIRIANTPETKEGIESVKLFKAKHELDSKLLRQLVENKITAMKQLSRLEEIISKQNDKDLDMILNIIKSLKSVIK